MLTTMLATPPSLSTTFPVVSPAGPGATMLVALQLVAVAVVPLNLTLLVPCVAPKFAPEIGRASCRETEDGFKLVSLGARTVNVKYTSYHAPLLIVYKTFHVVARSSN